MVTLGDNNSITIIKNDSNFIIFRLLEHSKDVDRVIFNLTKDGREVYRKELTYDMGLIPLEITGTEINADKYKYNLKLCFKNETKLTVLREKEFIVLEETIRC